MNLLLAGLVLFMGVLLESTIINMPFVLLMLVVLFVQKKTSNILILAFFLGVLLDILLVRTVGHSSIFFLCVLFLVYLYERKYETNTLPFIVIASIIVSIAYSVLFHGSGIIFVPLISSMVCVSVFILFTRMWK